MFCASAPVAKVTVNKEIRTILVFILFPFLPRNCLGQLHISLCPGRLTVKNDGGFAARLKFSRRNVVSFLSERVRLSG